MVSRIVCDTQTAQVFCPYALRELVKTFPDRKWNPDRKCWTIRLVYVDSLADALRSAGETVFLTRSDGSAYRTGARSHGHRGTPAPSWAETLLDAVGSDRVEPVFRALTRVLHPDAGGDHQLMAALTAARDAGRGLS